MRRLLLTLAALLLLAGACSDDGGSASDDAATTTEAPEGDGPGPPGPGPAPDIEDLPEGTVVFSSDDVTADVDGNETTWTPTVRDVEVVEGALEEYVDENPDLGIDDLDTYVRQYLGTGDRAGIVSINGLCDADAFNWQEELVAVEDGGSCFWNAEFSFFTLSFDSFQVNGEA
jgi:hypothetical protein